MLNKLRGLFSNDLSIDLGTANTLIYVKDQGIVSKRAFSGCYSSGKNWRT